MSWLPGLASSCRWFRPALALLFAATVAGCGFQLRGSATLPFETMYVPSNSGLLVELRRNLAAGTNTRLVASAADAQANFILLHEHREKLILSLDTAGRVREFQLRYRVGYRVAGPKGLDYLPKSEILLTREVSFNDAQVLAKEAEDALLYRDMQSDMVQQIMRRLAAARLREPD